MKKSVLSILLSLIILISLCTAPAYAATYSAEKAAQIAQLEKEIADIQTKMQAYGKSTYVGGTVYDTGSCFTVYQSMYNILTGTYENRYSVIDNPEDCISSSRYYSGFHKYLGLITIIIDNKKVVCDHYGSMGAGWYVLSKEKAAKSKQLDELKAKPDVLYANELRAYTGGALNRIAMQVGNQNFVAYGADFKFTDATPVIINGSTLLPIRAIIELSYGTADWDASTSTVTIQLAEKVIQLKSNDTMATVNGNTVTMATPAQIINSRLMVPLRFVAENLSMTVDWRSNDKVIIITNPNYESSIFAQRLTLSGDYYTYTDYTDISCSYSYPAAWGNPSILRTYTKGISVDNIKLNMPNAYLTITCELSPSTDLINKIKTPKSNYETVPLTDKNSGVEAIVKTTAAYSNSNNSGEVLILASNGYIYTLSWALNSMDNGLEQTMSDVLNIANSFSKTEGVG